MKYSALIPVLSSLLFLGTGMDIAQANGFFQEKKSISYNSVQEEPFQILYDSQQISTDAFIFDEYNPHNYYNPYYQKSFSENELPNVDSVKFVPEFQEHEESILEQKSEQAIRENSLHSEALPPIEDNTLLDDKTELSGLELSQLTSSNLIVSARKKQFFEKVLPTLLSNHRVTQQERQRLEKLLRQCERGNKIVEADELWLRQLAKHYHLSEDIL
ncbi:MAG: hypothetical protein OQL19_13385 [Gammaproteobacteria bacterium]|nr:hypothetical protein [Gammaproteobacteria bacterium]